MQKKIFIQFIATLVIFVILIATGVLIIYFKSKPKDNGTYFSLDYFKDRDKQIRDTMKNSDFVDIQDFIINVKNPVPEINRAILTNRNIFFSRDFNISINNRIDIPSNTIIKFDDNMILRSTNDDFGCLFNIQGATNATILGNNLRIEHSLPICIKGSKNILIKDLHLISPINLGVYIAGCKGPNCDPQSENVALKNIHIRRANIAGILIQSVKSLKAYNINIEYSATETGITVYPSNVNDLLEDIVIDHLKTKHAALIVKACDKAIDVIVNDYQTDSPVYLMNSTSTGKVRLENFILTNKEGIALIMDNWNLISNVVEVVNAHTNGKIGFRYMLSDLRNHKKDYLRVTNLRKIRITDEQTFTK